MFTLVIGGSASGKSEYAERLVSRLPGQRYYIATMQPWDGECLARIARHQAARAGRGFASVERYTDLAGLDLPQGCNALLECLSNLTANELYQPGGGGEAAVLSGVEYLHRQCGNLTVVTNEVFSGGAEYQGDTLHYLRVLGRVNRALARRADLVVEVVCGLPNVLKGAAIL